MIPKCDIKWYTCTAHFLEFARVDTLCHGNVHTSYSNNSTIRRTLSRILSEGLHSLCLTFALLGILWLVPALECFWSFQVALDNACELTRTLVEGCFHEQGIILCVLCRFGNAHTSSSPNLTIPRYLMHASRRKLIPPAQMRQTRKLGKERRYSKLEQALELWQSFWRQKVRSLLRHFCRTFTTQKIDQTEERTPRQAFACLQYAKNNPSLVTGKRGAFYAQVRHERLTK